jgi:hypothetical protein
MTASTVDHHLRKLTAAGVVVKQSYRHRGVRLTQHPLQKQ